MSTETNERYCERLGCTDKASKHWTRAGEGQVAEVSYEGAKIVMPIQHADLCDQHLSELQESFGGHVRELTDDCSPECPRA
jgi:hypothetical protein